MLVSILIVFVICWTPRVTQNFTLGYMRFSAVNPRDFELNFDEMFRLSTSLRMFSYMNSIVNVFIYYLTSK